MLRSASMRYWHVSRATIDPCEIEVNNLAIDGSLLARLGPRRNRQQPCVIQQKRRNLDLRSHESSVISIVHHSSEVGVHEEGIYGVSQVAIDLV